MFGNQMRLDQVRNFTRNSISHSGDETPLLATSDKIGVEIETENAGYLTETFLSSEDPRRQYWSDKDDGSLRGGGVEFVFNHPTGGSCAVDAIEFFHELCEGLPHHQRPSMSVRTSVHVHLDMRDTTSHQALRLLALYSIFEKVIFKSFARERINGHFAIPFNDCVNLTPSYHMLYQGWNEFLQWQDSPDVGRYSAVNLCALSRFGSLEFRHHGGTWDKERLLLWINLILSLKRASQREIDFASEFFFASQHGFQNHLFQFFRDDVAQHIIKFYEDNSSMLQFHRDMVRGIVHTQACIQPRINILK